ncbi:hypothetical protein [Ketogulonicigenium vulgare]|uniref:hypothetical protein n=1 Tax=Ketogulonicigenium vulgare TaxID=92945 RepID=UPI0003016187|nr:hypothetical protein [Ketogulonicigenium vulgare]
MTTLTDIPPFPADGYAPLADQIAQILHTQNDVLLIQAEAVVALEACAMSLGRPGASALNIVTSMYGQWFGGWLRRAGADVVDLQAAAGQPIALAAGGPRQASRLRLRRWLMRWRRAISIWWLWSMQKAPMAS